MTESHRFWAKVATGDGCWTWSACVERKGYGRVAFRGRTTRAHRVAWVLTHGDVPDGLYVLHRCDNRRCVNPAHLFLGTHHDNVADMVAKGRYVNARSLVTHCPAGHAYTASNTYRTADGRRCRACRLARAKARYRANASTITRKLREQRAARHHSRA